MNDVMNWIDESKRHLKTLKEYGSNSRCVHPCTCDEAKEMYSFCVSENETMFEFASVIEEMYPSVTY